MADDGCFCSHVFLGCEEHNLTHHEINSFIMNKVIDNHLSKGNQLTNDEPYVNHLGVGGERQFVHHTGEDGCHHQHVGQVHG